jgi:hypothetical protein
MHAEEQPPEICRNQTPPNQHQEIQSVQTNLPTAKNSTRTISQALNDREVGAERVQISASILPAFPIQILILGIYF